MEIMRCYGNPIFRGVSVLGFMVTFSMLLCYVVVFLKTYFNFYWNLWWVNPQIDLTITKKPRKLHAHVLNSTGLPCITSPSSHFVAFIL